MAFFSKNCMSIDFGDKFMKVVVGEYKNNQMKISHMFIKELRSGVWSSGKIQNFDEIKLIIKDLIDKNNLKVKNIVFTINSIDVIEQELELPIVSAEDRKNLIQYEMQEFIPEEIDDYFLQHKVISEKIIGDEKKNIILVAAMPKIMAEDYYNLSKSLELQPLSLDIHSNSITNLLKLNSYNQAGDEFNEKNFLVLDIGYKDIEAFVIEKGNYKFTRTIYSGINDFERILSTNKSIDLEEFNISDVFSLGSIEIDEELNYWGAEIKKIVNYYESLEHKNIDSILLYGGGSLLKSIGTELEDRINIKIKIIELNNFIDVEDNANIPIYMNAFGGLIVE